MTKGIFILRRRQYIDYDRLMRILPYLKPPSGSLPDGGYQYGGNQSLWGHYQKYGFQLYLPITVGEKIGNFQRYFLADHAHCRELGNLN